MAQFTKEETPKRPKTTLTVNSGGISIELSGSVYIRSYLLENKEEGLAICKAWLKELYGEEMEISYKAMDGLIPVFTYDELMEVSALLTILADTYMDAVRKQKDRLERMESNLSSVIKMVGRISQATEVTSAEVISEEINNPNGSKEPS